MTASYPARLVQCGSSIVEFLIILGVLLPIGFGAVMLGKLTDLQQNTEQASRYAAWEATVYSRNILTTQQSATVDRRLYHEQSGTLNSDQDQRETTVNEHPLWGRGAAAENTSGLLDLASVSRVAEIAVVPDYTFDTGRASVSAATGEIVRLAGSALSGFSGNSWGLVADGLLRSNIEVAVKPTGLLHALHGQCASAGEAGASTGPSANGAVSSTDDQADNDYVCMRSSGVILADGWSAAGDAQTVSRVRSLVPSSVLSTIGQGVGALLGATVFPELEPLDEAFGYVNMNVLPEYATP